MAAHPPGVLLSFWRKYGKYNHYLTIVAGRRFRRRDRVQRHSFRQNGQRLCSAVAIHSGCGPQLYFPMSRAAYGGLVHQQSRSALCLRPIGEVARLRVSSNSQQSSTTLYSRSQATVGLSFPNSSAITLYVKGTWNSSMALWPGDEVRWSFSLQRA